MPQSDMMDARRKTMTQHDGKTVKVIHKAGPAGFAFLAYIGAAIYFVQQTNGGFWEVVLALLQAIVWPVYVIYHVLQFLGA
jgi:hypothetical protein